MDLATIGLLTYGIHVLWLVIALVVLVVLLQMFVRTRMSGWIWLLFAVVVWPFLARGLSLVLPIYYAQQAQSGNRLVLTTLSVSAVETVIGGVLLLVAVLVLQRQIGERLASGQPVSQGMGTPVSGLPPYRG